MFIIQHQQSGQDQLLQGLPGGLQPTVMQAKTNKDCHEGFGHNATVYTSCPQLSVTFSPYIEVDLNRFLYAIGYCILYSSAIRLSWYRRLKNVCIRIQKILGSNSSWILNFFRVYTA